MEKESSEEASAMESLKQGYVKMPVERPSPVEMEFPEAMRTVIRGAKVTRMEWANKSIYVVLQGGYLMIKQPTGFHQLLVSEGDMRGEDWIVVK